MKDIKLIIYDFDGVLTDNRVLVDQNGVESVFCNRSDGLWISYLKNKGIQQMILSTETNSVVVARAKKLNIDVIHGQSDKWKALQQILLQQDLLPKNICYLGNDINDLDCLKNVGYPIAPRDAHPRVLAVAIKTLPVNGGEGVVRYLVNWLEGREDAY